MRARLHNGAATKEVLGAIGAAQAIGGRWPAALSLRDIPFLETPDLLPFLKDYVDHPAHGAYWEEWELAPRLAQIDVPCFHVSGWYDSFIPQTIAAYEALSTAGRAEHRLLVRPLVSHSMDAAGGCHRFRRRGEERRQRL